LSAALAATRLFDDSVLDLDSRGGRYLGRRDGHWHAGAPFTVISMVLI